MRRLIWWLVGLAATAFVGVAVVIVLRAELVERAVEVYLAGRGFPNASVSVSHVGFHRAAFDNLTLGPGLPAIERIEASYRIVEFLSLHLETIRIDGLRANIDARNSEAMERLAALAPRGARTEPVQPGPDVHLRDGRITFRNTGAGDFTVAFDGSMDLSRARARASLKAEARGIFGHASSRFRIDDLLGRPVAELHGEGRVNLALFPWPEQMEPKLQGGVSEFSYSGTLALPTFDDPHFASLLARDGELSVDLTLRGAALPPYAASADAKVLLLARTGGGALRLRLADHATVTARVLSKALPQSVDEAEFTLSAVGKNGEGKRMQPAWLKVSARKVGDAVAATVSGEMVWSGRGGLYSLLEVSTDLQAKGISLARSRADSLSWKGTGTLTSGLINLSGPMEVQLPVLRRAELVAEGAALQGRLEVSGGRGAPVRATLREASARVSTPPTLDRIRPKGAVTLTIPFARVERRPTGGIGLEAKIVPAAVDAILTLEGEEDVDLTATAKEIDVSLQAADKVSGRLRLRGGSIKLLKQNIEASKIEASVPFPLVGGGRTALLSGVVQETTDPARFVPLDVSARATPKGKVLRLSGTIRAQGLDVRIPFQGKFDLSERQGRIAFGPATMQFRPDALQPAMLGAALAAVKRAEGELGLSGSLAFAPGAPVESKAGVDFRDLTVESAEGHIEGLNGSLRLAGLFPPRTAGMQTLSARRAVVGLPLDEPSIRFRLQAAKSGPIVLIDRAEGRVADGLVYLENVRVDPSAARNALDIRIRGLSLARLLHDWAMEKITGTGALSGIVPVAITPGGVIIDAGKLRAEGGGVLRVHWGSSRDALMRQSEQVALMVRALEDFHYSALQISLDRPPDGSLSLRVTMEGRNPALKEGYPFRFNISLSGDLEKILVAIREGQRLGADLLQGELGGTR